MVFQAPVRRRIAVDVSDASRLKGFQIDVRKNMRMNIDG
jgi:hypothetical protein